MSLIVRFQRLYRRPPREVIRRIAGVLQRKASHFRLAMRDHLRPTYPADSDLPIGEVARLIAPLDSQTLAPWREILGNAADAVLKHRFNLLGSGWVAVGEVATWPGLEGISYPPSPRRQINHANRQHSRQVSHALSSDYRPIDWHVDFRSGYRWHEDAPYTKIAYGAHPGVDVKLPWELARMQHLSWLALAYAQARDGNENCKGAALLCEFQDQILDFIANNPPRFGVNWSCTMDVAIRAANWLVAYDLFAGLGGCFDAFFEREFVRSMLAHGRHIVSNLEWFPEFRSNHYLANIAGLFFIAAYLPASHETDSWLVLATNELGKEIFSQFGNDGSNFEGSTCYHRLSAEMVAFVVALALRIRPRLERLTASDALLHVRSNGPGILPEDRMTAAVHGLTSPATLALLGRMADFSRTVTRPDGKVVQIGDNDSGRFLKLTPDREETWSSGPDHASLIAVIGAMRGEIDDAPHLIEAAVVRSLVGKCDGGPPARTSLRLPAFTEFPDFGLYVYRRPNLWLAVRCGPVGQLGNGGHAHNDQLSFELCLNRVALIVDPGTYLYTPFPDERNAFRRTAAHATLAAGEQNSWLPGRVGLFSMSRVARTQILRADDKFFSAVHDGFGATHQREFSVRDDGIIVVDHCEAADRMLVLPLAPDVSVQPLSGRLGCRIATNRVIADFTVAAGRIDIVKSWFSPAYGCKIQTQSIHVHNIPPSCHWQIALRETGHA